MAKWHKTEYKLAPDHGWRATPGYKVIVIGRGLLQFEFPQSWHVEFTETSVKVTDKRPPDDNCVLQVSVLPVGPLKAGVKPSLTLLLQQAILNQGHLLTAEQIHHGPREDMEIEWGEYREMDPKEKREAVWRIALCHYGSVYGLLTFGFWPEEAERCDPYWKHVLSTMILDRYIEDPSRGPRLH